MESGKAAKLVAKVLLQCYKELDSSKEAVKSLWMQSRLNWSTLGMQDEDLGEFLEDQVSPSPPLPSLPVSQACFCTHAHTHRAWATFVERQSQCMSRTSRSSSSD